MELYPDIQWKIYANKENEGFCRNFRLAISKCMGDVIFLCDQDDVCRADKIEKMVDILN